MESPQGSSRSPKEPIPLYTSGRRAQCLTNYSEGGGSRRQERERVRQGGGREEAERMVKRRLKYAKSMGGV